MKRGVRVQIPHPGPSRRLSKCFVRVLPNTRVKLAAPTSKGIHLFVKTKTLRGSLRAFR
jgi:hypothetical protein